MFIISSSKNFKYLDDLIHSGAKEIFLDLDIVLDSDEKSQYLEGIELDIDDLVIDGNGHLIDAKNKTGIFNINSKVTIKNLTLKNGYAIDGGAINIQDGDVEIDNCQFQNNTAKEDGGAIINWGKLTITETLFNENSTQEVSGGAINIQKAGDVEISDCQFLENTANKNGGAIHNFGKLTITETLLKGNSTQENNGGAINIQPDGDVEIDNCQFQNNTANKNGGAIINWGKLTITKTLFNENSTQENNGGAINIQDGDVEIDNCQFQNNTAKEDGGAINNLGVMTIKDSTFNGNDSNESSQDIFNQKTLTLSNLHLNTKGKTIKNKNEIILSSALKGIEEKICNEAKVYLMKDNEKSFTYLDDCIHSNSIEIKLHHDIKLDVFNNEDKIFSEGILIDVDDLVIDGNGHSIDAQDKTRIFYITGKNITIKNLILKNGHGFEECGGAIHNIGELTIKDVALEENKSNKNGGAINNKGTLTITDVTFTNNAAKNEGGAINNYKGIISISDATINNNSGNGGGVYNNSGTIKIENTTLDENASKRHGAGIYNLNGTITIKSTALHENAAKKEGGGIYNDHGMLAIDNGALHGNSAENGGGALINRFGTVTIDNTTFLENIAEDGGAIANYGNFTIKDTTFIKNIGKNEGGAIKNEGRTKKFRFLTIENTTFRENTALNGGAIHNYINGNIIIKNTLLCKNTAKESGGAIYNRLATIGVKNTLFQQNDSMEKFSQDIYNDKELTLLEPQFSNDEKTIQNLKTIYIKEKIEYKIFNTGDIVQIPLLDDNQNNFEYLDELVHGKENEIKLEQDIQLDFTNLEDAIYHSGIPVDVDDIIIDGNGHTIDARGKTRIFNISGRNVTLKNIILKNGNASEGGAIENEGELTLQNSELINNIAFSEGGAIENEGELTLQNSELINNIAFSEGGAIKNNDEGFIKIENCTIQKNKASKEGIRQENSGVKGGAIINEGVIEIYDSRIECNFAICAEFPARSSGGAIYNCPDANLTIMNSVLNDNVTMIDGGKFLYTNAGALSNLGKTLITHCEIKNNKSSHSIIDNRSQMSIFNSIIEENYLINEYGRDSSSIVIENSSDSSNHPSNLYIESTKITNHKAGGILANSLNSILSISGGEISNNVVEFTISSSGSSSISRTMFYNNYSKYFNSMIIQNRGDLILKNPKIKDGSYKSILNNGKIIISSSDLRKIIDNQGIIKNGFYNEGNNDFTKLNDLIHSDDKEIILDNDYVFEEYEMDFFEGGIELDIDDLIIDGQNHVIDAREMSRIFLITGKNITLKNIIFKNGHTFVNHDSPINNDGGALRINETASLSLHSCSFENNLSSRNGGSIINSGKLNLKSVDMKENCAINGGAICNWGKIRIQDSSMSNNSSKLKGGAIFNQGKIAITNVVLNENVTAKRDEHEILYGFDSFDLYGGAIHNCQNAYLKIYKSTLSNNVAFNHVKDDASISCNGGAISNFGEIEIDSSRLQINKTMISTSKKMTKVKDSISNGGAIYNHGKITVLDSNFSDNSSRKGGAIDNESNATLTIINTQFKKQNAGNGGAIFNDGTIQIKNSLFADNSASGIFPYGGAIRNENNMMMDKCILKNNDAYYGGAIHNKGTMQIESSDLEENKASRIGGAIYMDDGELNLTDTTFIKNDAGEGKTEIKVINEKKYKINPKLFQNEMLDYERRIQNLKSTFSENHSYVIRLECDYDAKFMQRITITGGAIWTIDKNRVSIKDCKFEDNMPNSTNF